MGPKPLHAAVVAVVLAVLGSLPGFAASDAEISRFAAAAFGVDPGAVTLTPADAAGREVRVDGEKAGFIGSTWEISRTSGYSSRPIDVLVLVDLDAVVRGTLLVQQEEPVLTLGITPEQISSYVGGFAGYDLKNPLKEARLPPGIAGATISSGVIRSGILHTARSIANHNGLLDSAGQAAIDMRPAKAVPWPRLLEGGGVVHRLITAKEADAALGVIGTLAPESEFIDLYLAVADPPETGTSLLGDSGYAALMASLDAGSHALFVGASGLYSFKGTQWRKSGQFERIELTQGGRTIPLLAEQHRPLETIAANGAPELRERAIFILPHESGFDPVKPFQLAILASREDGSGVSHSARFTLDHALPQRLLKAPTQVESAAEKPLWEQNWQSRVPAIAIVLAMLLALYVILIFQNQIAARPKLYRQIRIAYLLMTLVVLGGLLSAQLSVVHVLTFVQALRGEFSWETFLLDPVIFIIWGWVAVALLFWGRVYCGWLCPFGALQDLLNTLAQKLGIRQFSVPFMLHERLWPIKYIIFLGLFAVSLASMTLAFKGAEAEPFKTAITFRFVREWPFVLYAVVLLAAGLFVERFYCRYLCPLGAALAIPARLRMFEWLKRRPQCGRECRICSTKCPVQAIHPEGHINPNECVYCLNCQTLYHDEHICPPLKARAARRPVFTQSGKPIT